MKEFTGNIEAVITVHTPEALKKWIRAVDLPEFFDDKVIDDSFYGGIKMNKTEQCTEIIKEFLDSLKGKVESVTLKSGTVRKWKEIDVLCENQDSAMICTAMKRARSFYNFEILHDAIDSTTLEIEYKVCK